ncbi:MAG: hypothetical protein RLP02_14225 [Coleofasciculus sp. C2-GNP5-27]
MGFSRDVAGYASTITYRTYAAPPEVGQGALRYANTPYCRDPAKIVE